MKKIKLFLLSLSFLFIPNVFSMFARTMIHKASIARIKPFHTTTSTPKTMDWKEGVEQENNFEPLLKKIIAQNNAILKQNHIMFLHHINDRIPINYTARENMIQKTKDDLTNLYNDHNIDIANCQDK